MGGAPTQFQLSKHVFWFVHLKGLGCLVERHLDERKLTDKSAFCF